MKLSYTKPALIVGFSLLVLPALSWAQDYIDVEAERKAARAGSGGAASVEVISASAGAADAPSSDYPSSGYPSSDSTSSGYSRAGIRPYSGETITTTTANSPVASQLREGSQNADSRNTGALNTGSLNTGALNTGSFNVGSLVVQLQQLQEEVRRLNGLVEEQAQEVQRLKEQSLERYVDLDRRLAGAAGQSGLPADSANGSMVSANPAASRGESSATPLQAGEEAAYQQAYDLVKTRQFDDAVKGFRGFLAEYPFGRYAPNAHYWLGELYLVLDPPDAELARQSFKLLLDQYPDDPKVPDAIYKLGRVHFLKGNRDRSREYLNKVITEYPGHPAAQLAQDFINDNF